MPIEGKYYHNCIFPYYGSYLPRIEAADTANRFFPTLGNHDNNNLAHAYLEYFTLPEAYPGNERYYTFTVGDVRMIVVANPDSITFCFRNIHDSLVDCYTIHKATDVPVKKGTDLSIFPDPFRNQARMQTSHDLDHAILTVYDAFGKQVRQLTDVSGHSLMLHRGNLPCGIYFLRIIEYGKPGFSCKFVITD
jgi:hypothetical protein